MSELGVAVLVTLGWGQKADYITKIEKSSKSMVLNLRLGSSPAYLEL